MNTKINYIETENKKIPFAYTLNVMEAIQTEYGSLNNWASLIEPADGGEPNLKALLVFFKEAINEGIDIENEKTNETKAFLTERQTGRLISEIGIQKAGEKLKELIIDASDSKQDTLQEQKN